MELNYTDSLYSRCTQCPRSCKIDRFQNNFGFCKESSKLKIALACLHYGEEPLITVFNGSGTIFISGCTLRCSFCQNYQISQNGLGDFVDENEFVKICLELEKAGAENINIVTGSHHIPILAKYLSLAKEAGLKIPIAWNSSAYESVEMLELLKGVVDIWLPDLKTLNSDLSKKLFFAEDYPEVAKKAISWMIENSPLKIEKKNLNGEDKEKIVSGVIIRHLFLPGRIEDTITTLQWLDENANSKACISLMSQYTPVPFKEEKNQLEKRNASLENIENRLVSKEEDEDLQDLINIYDFDYLFYQELSDDTSWLPDFEKVQSFSNKLSKTIWHWKDKFCYE